MAPALALGGLYALLALLLLGLHLKSGWRWRVKTAAIMLALPASLGTFLAIEAQTGWPSDAPLPERFLVHAALVDEPARGRDDGGAIFLWASPLAGEPTEGVETEETPAPPLRPRAFALPYSRDLHQQVETMRERLARGEAVIGRHQAGKGWQRRFDSRGGGVDLEAPPPPPLPKKDG